MAPTAVIVSLQRVAVAAPRLWSVIAEPGYLENCHPFCEYNPAQRWQGTGSIDTIHYYNGRVVDRRFTAWTEGSGYDLVVGDDRGAQAEVRWRITAEGDDTCRLAITLTPRYAGHLPRPLRPLVYAATRRRMQRYLDAVVAGIVFYAETGTPVQRNQFGSHPWFSPAVSIGAG